MQKLIALSEDKDKRIAIKACTEILDRIDRKTIDNTEKWFVSYEND